MATNQIDSLRSLLSVGVFTLVAILFMACGMFAKTPQTKKTILRSEYTDSREKQYEAPHSDCLAYAKLGITPSENFIDDLISLGKRYLGKPYRYRGAAPWPFDCSGYVRFLFSSFGIKLAGSSASIAQATIPIDDPQPGDLVFFKGRNRKSSRVGHVALIVEVKPNGSIVMMHSTNQNGIVLEHINSNQYFAKRYLGARRIPSLFNYFEQREKGTNTSKKALQKLPPCFIQGTLVPNILLLPTVVSQES